jgi:hypothetical protein
MGRRLWDGALRRLASGTRDADVRLDAEEDEKKTAPPG